MTEPIVPTATSDRLKVFISSTIKECAAERTAARAAITGLNFEPVQFEREGARAEPPRHFYLRKLQDSHIVVGIYRESYGWIDAKNDMALSGLEDEYRASVALDKDLLAYVLEPAGGRDARLAAMLEDITAGPNTVYFYTEGEDLEERIRDDITALISARFAPRASGQPTQPAAELLRSIFRGSPVRIRRDALLNELSEAATAARIVWVTGQAGAGKTALAAEWAQDRGAAFVTARGLDPRATLIAIAQSIGVASGAELATPLFDDVRNLLARRWGDGRNWPLVLDDPDDMPAVWSVLREYLGSSAIGSIIVVARDPDPTLAGTRMTVGGFSAAEIAALHEIADKSTAAAGLGDLPLSLRRGRVVTDQPARFGALEPVAREAVGYLALSPAPLDLDDLLALLGDAAGGPVATAARLELASDLIMATPAGYTFVHDAVRDDVAATIGARVQLSSLLRRRLGARLARTGRAWAAFRLRRDEDPQVAAGLANRAVREAAFSGSNLHLMDALEHLAGYYRKRAEHGPLISTLMALADAKSSQGRANDAPALLAEARMLAVAMGDGETRSAVDILEASLALRRSASQAALERVRDLRREADADGRASDSARLLLEEGIAMLAINENDLAVPLFRKAVKFFETTGDAYGVEVGTRNLIASLSATPDGFGEAERLRGELDAAVPESPRYRAWLCNMLVPRLRRERRFDDAEAMAREAIAIGEELGDRYLVAINNVALGNVLREAGRFPEALDALAAGGSAAQSIGRPDIEGRSSRLSALTENVAAERSEGAVRRAHAGRAEQFAMHAVALLSGTFAWGDRAHALEELGDARRLLSRDGEAVADYAHAIRDFLKAADEAEVGRLLPFLLRMLEDRDDAAETIAAAFGPDINRAALGDSGVWIQAVLVVLNDCPLRFAASCLGSLVRSFAPAQGGSFWLQRLIRCLLVIDRELGRNTRPDTGPILLLAILAFSRHREMNKQDLLTLAGICLADADGLVARHRPGSDLDLIVLTAGGRVLLTVRTEAQAPEAIYVALVIACFLTAYGEQLTAILFSEELESGVALDVVVFAADIETGPLREFTKEALETRPVAAGRLTPAEGEEVPIVIFARADTIAATQAVPTRGGELEIALAQFLEEITHATLGRSLDDEIYAEKIKELLLSALR
ncbi:DUF4062 domain-containing protein [Sphingomonas sp. PB2P12]|uniref:DUF4062 domain-containing protein n=1 Tax=Sphingomonas sandaracina TaxID=3096157 RepID=UPI002FC9A1D6